MLRFNSKAYDEVYPRQEKEVVETVVETFTPTTDEQKKEVEEVEEVNEVSEVTEDDENA